MSYCKAVSERIHKRICLDCSGSKDNNHLRCIICQQKQRERNRILRESRKIIGICPACKNKVSTNRIYCDSCSKSGSERVKEAFRKTKRALIKKLGGKCVCCNISEYEFLCVDHINGGGRQDRERFPHAHNFYKYILTLENPFEKYRLLCWNCNSAYGLYGFCPHKNSPNLTYDVFQVIEN